MNEDLPEPMIEAAARTYMQGGDSYDKLTPIEQEHVRDQATSILEAALAGATVDTEWLVHGDPGHGYPPYDFPYRAGPDTEHQARKLLELIEIRATEFAWDDGPHLSSRVVITTPWMPAPEAEPTAGALGHVDVRSHKDGTEEFILTCSQCGLIGQYLVEPFTGRQSPTEIAWIKHVDEVHP